MNQGGGQVSHRQFLVDDTFRISKRKHSPAMSLSCEPKEDAQKHKLMRKINVELRLSSHIPRFTSVAVAEKN